MIQIAMVVMKGGGKWRLRVLGAAMMKEAVQHITYQGEMEEPKWTQKEKKGGEKT